jgi:hypothetical protein
MDKKLTQPEEIDQILKHFADGDVGLDSPVAAGECFPKMHVQAEVRPWMGASTSAYRAAYMMKFQNIGS